MIRHQAALRIIGMLAVIACAARVIHLNADPSVANWIGYVVDEGRWSEIARNLALFGNADGTANARLHLLLTPGYQAVNYVSFWLFGVDFWSARLFAALSGILVVAVVFSALRRHVTPFALAIGVVILGFETNLLSESRIALPEMPSVAFTLLAFLVLVCGRATRGKAFMAGLLAAIAVALKGTTIMVMPVFPVILLFLSRSDLVRARVARVLAFVAGFALLVVVGLVAALASGVFDLEGIAYNGGRILVFFGLASPYVAVMRFFDSQELEARNLLLLGAWYCSWLWFYRDASAPSILKNLYLASGAWAAWWLIAWSGGQYLPGRYVVHWIVPATIHVMAGLSLAGRGTFASIAEALGQRRGWLLALSLAWLVVPTAIFLAAVASGLAGINGWDTSSLSHRFVLIAAISGTLAIAVRRSASHPSVIAAFLIFPVVMTLFWLAGRELGTFEFFWQFESKTVLAVWMGIGALTFAACVVLARPPQSPAFAGAVQVGFIVALMGIFFAQGATAILQPTYSIRNASLDLQQWFPAGSQVRTYTAESLFLANQLEFRAIAPRETRYDGLVIFEHGSMARGFFASNRTTNLVRVASYPITIHPRYRTHEDRFGPASVAIYKPK